MACRPRAADVRERLRTYILLPGMRIYFGWQCIKRELLHTLVVFVARDYIVTTSRESGSLVAESGKCPKHVLGCLIGVS